MPQPRCEDEVRSRWEAAYAAFESPEQETRKFLGRLKRLRADEYARDSRVLELFCGRGSGLVAWERLGFRRVIGADLSISLLQAFPGRTARTAADARDLPFGDGSFDVVSVQGGLHHLELPDGLERTLAEIRRVLSPSGRFLLVEPWDGPFLRVVHAVSRNPLARRLWKRLDAFASMVCFERDTYEKWLGSPDRVLESIVRHFHAETLLIGWGKIFLAGSPNP